MVWYEGEEAHIEIVGFSAKEGEDVRWNREAIEDIKNKIKDGHKVNLKVWINKEHKNITHISVRVGNPQREMTIILGALAPIFVSSFTLGQPVAVLVGVALGAIFAGLFYDATFNLPTFALMFSITYSFTFYGRTFYYTVIWIFPIEP